MPYFIFRISSRRELTPVGSYEKYGDAREKARSIRAELGPADATAIKVIFAKNPEDAERLLSARRERRPSEDD